MKFLPLTPKGYGKAGDSGRYLLSPAYCLLANSLCSTDQLAFFK